MAGKVNKEKCEECGELIPENEMIVHLKTHLNDKKEPEPKTEGPPKIGNRDISKMINASDDAYIIIRVKYLDNNLKNSKNGDFRRAVVEPVKNCNFDEQAYLIGKNLTVGKRIERFIQDDETLLTHQFELQLIETSYNNSRPYVDINDIIVLDDKKQISAENAEKYFPKFEGATVKHR